MRINRRRSENNTFLFLDVCFLLWLASLVQGFQNKLLRAPPKDFMETHFERDIQSVAQFQDCVEKNQRTQSSFVDILMTGLTKGRVGIYSMFHDKSVRKYGYDSDQSILLAYMCARAIFPCAHFPDLCVGLTPCLMQVKLDIDYDLNPIRTMTRISTSYPKVRTSVILFWTCWRTLAGH